MHSPKNSKKDIAEKIATLFASILAMQVEEKFIRNKKKYNEKRKRRII